MQHTSLQALTSNSEMQRPICVGLDVLTQTTKQPDCMYTESAESLNRLIIFRCLFKSAYGMKVHLGNECHHVTVPKMKMVILAFGKS